MTRYAPGREVPGRAGSRWLWHYPYVVQTFTGTRIEWETSLTEARRKHGRPSSRGQALVHRATPAELAQYDAKEDA